MKYRVLYETVDDITGQSDLHESPWYDSKTLAEGAEQIIQRDECVVQTQLQSESEEEPHYGH
jgi:hypothetical protein